MTKPNDYALLSHGALLRRAEDGLKEAKSLELKVVNQLGQEILDFNQGYNAGDEEILSRLKSRIRRYERKRDFYSREDLSSSLSNDRVKRVLERYNPQIQPIIDNLNNL